MLIPGFTVQQNIAKSEPLQKNLFSRLIGKSFDTIDIEAMQRDALKALIECILMSALYHVALLPVGINNLLRLAAKL